MSVDESATIDFVALDKITGDITLAISDHLHWDDKILHANLIMQKINTYIEFVETGQVYETFPQQDGQKIFIQVTHKYQIPTFALKFFEQIRELLNGHNLELRMKYLPDDPN